MVCIVIRNLVIFYGEELLAPRPTPKLEGHPLSAVRDCLFHVFAPTLHIRRPFLHPQPEDAPCRGDRDRLIMGQFYIWEVKAKLSELMYNDCCSGKAIRITHSESVVLATQNVMHMRHVMSSVACLALPYFAPLSHKRKDFRKYLLNLKCAF
jgi:hypothetical protein